jgi:hypothetical protein
MPVSSNARAVSWKGAGSEHPWIDFLFVDFPWVDSLWIEEVG